MNQVITLSNIFKTIYYTIEESDQMDIDFKAAREFQLQFSGMEVDTIKTAAQVRDFFKNDYKKLLRMAGVHDSFIKSPVISDDPKSPAFGNKGEEKLVKRLYAQETLVCVSKAINVLSYESKQILIGVYADNKNVWDMCDLVGCERAQYQVKKRKAENEFADAFETCCSWWKNLHSYK